MVAVAALGCGFADVEADSDGGSCSQTATCDPEGLLLFVSWVQGEGWPTGPTEIHAHHPEVSAPVIVDCHGGPGATPAVLTCAPRCDGGVLREDGVCFTIDGFGLERACEGHDEERARDAEQYRQERRHVRGPYRLVSRTQRQRESRPEPVEARRPGSEAPLGPVEQRIHHRHGRPGVERAQDLAEVVVGVRVARQHRALDEVQKITDRFVADEEKMLTEKEADLLEI